jgi:hydrogenase expression/formation protein HypD
MKMKPYYNRNLSSRNINDRNISSSNINDRSPSSSNINDRNISNIVSEIKTITANIVKKPGTVENARVSMSGVNKINIMEVCGTHTMSIARYGIAQLLPPEISLISGPGCPVCVTSASDIDTMIEMIKVHEITAFTFGDMLRVPGTHSSLFMEKTSGKDIRVCYSPLDALDFAADNPGKNVVFVAIGFETTVPMTSVVIKRASEKKLKNFSVFSTHKIVPPALKSLLSDKEVSINGFLLPGHVSVIIGSTPYLFIARDYYIPGVIAGFDAYDVLISILMILKQIKNKKSSVEIEYKRVVRPEGNPDAVKAIYEVFEIQDCQWRGLGMIAQSGLKIKDIFAGFDAKKIFPVKKISSKEPAGCKCGMVLKGILKPCECGLFGKSCRPDSPVGPCMVSSEGTCAAYFKYLKLLASGPGICRELR